jgi:hypothetical protein
MTGPARPGSRTDPRRGERGLATVEAVLVVPLVLVPVLLAVVVFGRLEHTRLVLDAAAAAGARQAAVVGGDSSLVRTRIDDELRNGGINPNRVTVTIEPGVANWGDPIRVRLEWHRPSPGERDRRLLVDRDLDSNRLAPRRERRLDDDSSSIGVEASVG